MNIKNKKLTLAEFIKTSKISILITIIFLLFGYGQRLFSIAFSIDTELYIRSYISNYTWWLSLDRWGLVLFNKFFKLGPLPIFQTNILTFSLIIVYSVLLNYLFYLYIDEKYEKKFICWQFVFSLIFISSPIFAEIYNFAILNAAVAAGICLIALAQIILQKASLIKDKFYKNCLLILTIVLGTFSFGIYQAIIPLYILIVTSLYFLQCLKEKNSSFNWLLKQIIIFGIIAILYFVINNCIGISNDYLNNGWLKGNISQCIINIFQAFKELLKGKSIFYNYGYVISIGLIIIYNIYKIFKKKTNFGLILSSLGLVLGPLYIFILTGEIQLKRTQFNYPYTIAFIFLLLMIFLQNKKAHNIYLRGLVSLVILYFAYSQMMITGNLFYTDSVRYQKDVELAAKIQNRIESQEWYDKNKKYTLIFYGRIKNQTVNSYIKGEIIGKSFFEFDYKYHYGVSDRATAFLESLGYYYNAPTIAEFDEAKKYATTLPSLPNKNCIFNKENYIIVKLSDDI